MDPSVEAACGVREFLVLRFRDLVTEPGGTVTEHRRILHERGSVWWGWWMRQHERAPRELLARFYVAIEEGRELEAFLFDAGRGLLFPCAIADIRVAPEDEQIGPPEIELAPAYYQRGRYPAWFQLSNIEAQGVGEIPESWRYVEFPTNPDRPQHKNLIGQTVSSPDELRNTDATLWVVSAVSP